MWQTLKSQFCLQGRTHWCYLDSCPFILILLRLRWCSGPKKKNLSQLKRMLWWHKNNSISFHVDLLNLLERHAQTRPAFIFESSYKQILNEFLPRHIAAAVTACLFSLHIWPSYFAANQHHMPCPILFHTTFQPSPLPSWLIIKLLLK